MLSRLLLLSALATAGASAQSYTATYVPSASGLPKHTENGQTGTNKCGTDSSPDSTCQNAYINSVTDFCLWAPPETGGVADYEATVLSYCTKSGRGTRVIPDGTIKGAQFVYAPSYVQVSGYGDFTNMNIVAGDEGGELDPHGATGVGNPVGGLVFHCTNGSCQQMHEWMSFMSADQFCFRACYDGDRATSLCRHTYDVLGCDWNMPADYPTSYFETCDSNDAQDVAWHSGTFFAQDNTLTGATVPPPHPAPATSSCSRVDGAALYGSTDFATGVVHAGQQSPSTSSTVPSSSTSTSISTSSISTTSSSTSPLTTTTRVLSTVGSMSSATSPTSSAQAAAQAGSAAASGASALLIHAAPYLASLTAVIFAGAFVL